ELAAATVGVFSLTQIVAHLDRPLDFLVSRQRGVAPRHRSLRASLAWSYNLLPSELQGFFRSLSAFQRGFTAEQAQELTRDQNASSHLEALCSHSLLTAHVEHGSTRF